MLEITELKAFNLEGAIRGMRQPFKNTEKSDSVFYCDDSLTHDRLSCREGCGISLGPNDLRIAQGLIKAGSPHDKFMRQIFVSMDINAPLYWWKEMDTYKVATTANSESTMHTIMKTGFSIHNFSHDESFYNNNDLTVQTGMTVLQQQIFLLNMLRTHYLNEEDPIRKKEIWRTIIQLLPCSYMQKRTWSASYATLRPLTFQRDGHKLTEWETLRNSFRDLPYAEELIFYKGEPTNVD